MKEEERKDVIPFFSFTSTSVSQQHSQRSHIVKITDTLLRVMRINSRLEVVWDF
jgi:hypothetical protein